jgi:flagellar protein FliO/FliZ
MTPQSLLITLLALLGVVGLILLTRRAALLLPRLARLPGAAGPLRLEQTLALDTRRRLLLVQCGAEKVLLLTGGPQDVVVGWPNTAGATLKENPEPPP